MNQMWLLNKIAALVISAAILLAFVKYFRIYNFGIPQSNYLFFWVPLGLVGGISIAVYVWTFKVKKDDS